MCWKKAAIFLGSLQNKIVTVMFLFLLSGVTSHLGAFEIVELYAHAQNAAVKERWKVKMTKKEVLLLRSGRQFHSSNCTLCY